MIRRPPRSPLFPSTPLFRSFQSLELERFGLEWIQPPIALAHPLDGGRAVWLKRDLETTASQFPQDAEAWRDRKSTRLNSSHANISYAVFCLKKKNQTKIYSH